jgi:hypothetical protein
MRTPELGFNFPKLNIIAAVTVKIKKKLLNYSADQRN